MSVGRRAHRRRRDHKCLRRRIARNVINGGAIFQGFYEHRNMMSFDFSAEVYADDDEPLTYFEYPPRRR